MIVCSSTGYLDVKVLEPLGVICSHLQVSLQHAAALVNVVFVGSQEAEDEVAILAAVLQLRLCLHPALDLCHGVHSVVELEMKAIRRFAKISQSQRSALLRPSPG